MREFLVRIDLEGGAVTGGLFKPIGEEDLPRPLPSPAGGYHLMTATVDQLGRVRAAASGSPADVIAALGYTPEPAISLLPLTKGGTETDLSAAGPGVVFQGTTGGALASGLNLSAVGDFLFGKVTCSQFYTNSLNAAADTLVVFEAGVIGTNQVAAAAGPVGAVVGKLPIYDAALNLLGYIPVYDDIT